MDVELRRGGDGNGREFLFDPAESASGFGADIFTGICQISRTLEKQDRHFAVGWRTGTSGEVKDSRRNRIMAVSGTYAGVESE